MKGCSFCEIYEKKFNVVPYEDDLFFSQLDRYPVLPGHTEIVPKKHIPSLHDLTMIEWMQLKTAIENTVDAVNKTDLQMAYESYLKDPIDNVSAWFCQKALESPNLDKEFSEYNLGLNEGRYAGRTIDHIHFHLIPRFPGDVEDYIGGVRHMIPWMGDYKRERAPEKSPEKGISKGVDENKPDVYFGAALFNGREKAINMIIADKLEEKNDLFLPQRDGFEFVNLFDVLSEIMPAEKISDAVQDIIYHFDIGYQLPRQDVVLANLDEPIDEGLAVELSYASFLDKPTIGYRTDARSPYGRITDRLGGAHMFPVFQCDYFIRESMKCRSMDELDEEANRLAEKIDSCIAEEMPFKQDDYGNLSSPKLKKTIENAELLFEGLDIHSDLEGIANRYSENLESFRGIRFL